jgi:hypothetical protein
MSKQRLLLTVAAVWLLPDAALAAELTLKRVMLSTGGVGYFEYEATVTGDEVLELPVRLDQVDDVMKSLVIYDSAGGIGDVSLPGRAPLTDVFRDLPFDQSALASPVALLDALRGAEIEVTGARTLKGRILSVTSEQVQLPNGQGLVTRTRVSLMTAAGVSQFLLEEADSLTFTDPGLQAAVDKALAAMAEHGTRDSRTLELMTFGQGQRTVTVAYVVEAPLWKTSYRLTLDSTPGAKLAQMQGWAVLENMSGEDWVEVELTLVSGNPVTFRQALYNTYYVARPEIPVEVLGRVLPPVDDEKQLAGELRGGYAEGKAEEYDDRARDLASPAPAPAASQPYYAESSANAAPEPAAIVAAASSEATTQVIFTFPEPVTLESGHSLLLPFVSRDVPAERVAYFDPATHPTHPLATVILENDGESGLPPGVITLYERNAQGAVAFVGDARLAALPAGETRLVSYALDQKVAIRQEVTSDQTVTQVRVVNGVMMLISKELYRTSYEIEGAAKEERVVLLEHPRWEGWTLVEPEEEQLETTTANYRALVAVPAGETRTMTFGFERPTSQAVYLSSIDDGSLDYYLEASFVPETVKQQLALLVNLRGDLADRRRELSVIDSRINQIIADQGRIRQNLQSVPAESDLQRRYLEQLGQQEDELATLRTASEAKRQEVAAAEAAVAAFLKQLSI